MTNGKRTSSGHNRKEEREKKNLYTATRKVCQASLEGEALSAYSTKRGKGVGRTGHLSERARRLLEERGEGRNVLRLGKSTSLGKNLRDFGQQGRKRDCIVLREKTTTISIKYRGRGSPTLWLPEEGGGKKPHPHVSPKKKRKRGFRPGRNQRLSTPRKGVCRSASVLSPAYLRGESVARGLLGKDLSLSKESSRSRRARRDAGWEEKGGDKGVRVLPKAVSPQGRSALAIGRGILLLQNKRGKRGERRREASADLLDTKEVECLRKKKR